MQAKLLKLGTALSVATAFLNATTAPAAAGGYDYNAALINTYIQSAPWTSYGDSYRHGWTGWDTAPYSSGAYGYGHASHGWAPRYDAPHYDAPHYDGPHYDVSHYDGPHYDGPHYDWPKAYVSTLGHGTLSYYDLSGGHVYYGDPAFAKRTTIVRPTVTYDGHAAVIHDAYGDDHMMHVGSHATELRSPVFFASGSSTLSPEARHELKQIGHIISAYYFDHPKVLILLSGFTDAAGSQSANEALARARNHAVKDYLIAEFGFDKARFVLRAVGEEYANLSAVPHGDNQRKVTVSLIGLPKSVTDHGHQHHAPAMAEAEAPTAPAALDKGALPQGEPETGEEHAMAAPAPVMKPMPKPAQAERMQPTYVDHAAPVTRCTVPSGPYAGTYVDGKLLATLFTDIDDYGGGKLEEVCGLSY